MRAHLPAPRRTHAFPLEIDAPRRSASPVRCAGSIVSLPGGSIAADVRAIALDRRRGTVTYEVRVVNETGSGLAAFAYSADDATIDELSWSSVVVPARASIALPIELAFAPHGRVPRLIVQLFGHRTTLTLDGEPPPSSSGAEPSRRGGRAVAAAALLAAGATAYFAQVPRVAALGVPAAAPAGASVEVAYALGGDAEGGRYRLERDDGNEVSSGALPGQSGFFAVTLPPGTGGSYAVTIETQTPLGRAARAARIVALAPPPSRAHPRPASPERRARIGSIALSTNDVKSGDSFEVTYSAQATAGTVKVLDQEGTVRGEALYSPQGSTLLLAPLVDRDQDMRVVLDVASGESRDEASAPVRIRAAAPAAPAPASAAPPEDAAPAAAAAARPLAGVADGPLTFPRETYRSNDTIEIGVRYDEPDLHLSLSDAQGAHVASVDAVAGAASVSFRAPRVDRPSRYVVVATYARGFSVETIIHSLTILPIVTKS